MAPLNPGGAASPRTDLRAAWKRRAKFWRKQATEARAEKWRVLDAIHKAGVNVRLAVRFGEAEAAQEAPAPEGRYGWHGEGTLCLGAECLVLDDDGDHPTADVHSNDWYDGYAAGQRDAALGQEAPAPEGLRAAAQAVVDNFPGLGDEYDDDARAAFAVHFGRLEAALAATPPTPAEPPRGTICVCGLAKSYHPRLAADHEYEPRYRAEARPPEGLDAERLANAYNNVIARIGVGHGVSMRVWNEVPAEYARLSAGGAE